MLNLRDYQRAGLTALDAAEQHGISRALLAWPTGTGKTILFGAWCLARPGRTLILAHREELLDQTRDKLHLLDASADVGIVQAERDEYSARIVVASVATLRQSNRLLRVVGEAPFANVIIDEAHHAAADSYQKVLRSIRHLSNGFMLLGVTATPERGDRKALCGVTFDQIVHRLGLVEAIRDGYLSDIRALRVRINVDLDTVTVTHGDFSASALETALIDASAPSQIAQAVRQLAHDRRVLIFTPGVESARQTAVNLGALGIATAAIDGETPSALRASFLHDFRSGALRALSNCMVLTEGYDEPAIDCVVIARPTLSLALYTQMIGRGLRPYPGKEHCLILDCVGASRHYDPLALSTMLHNQANARVLDSVANGESLRAALAAAPDGTVQSEVVHRPSTFAWVKYADGWMLSLGSRTAGYLLLRESTAGWDVVRRIDGSDDTVWSGAYLDYAQGVAEDVVRNVGVPKVLVTVDASWRSKVATLAQREALQKAGIRVPLDGLTRGEAADALTWYYGQRKGVRS